MAATSWNGRQSHHGVPILRGREVVGLAQDGGGVDVEVSDGSSLRAQYLVGCDGGPSVVRTTAGIDLVDATYDGVWELPVIGDVPAPAAVLIRPDGHVAWVGGLTDPELTRALSTWFGVTTPEATDL